MQLICFFWAGSHLRVTTRMVSTRPLMMNWHPGWAAWGAGGYWGSVLYQRMSESLVCLLYQVLLKAAPAVGSVWETWAAAGMTQILRQTSSVRESLSLSMLSV